MCRARFATQPRGRDQLLGVDAKLAEVRDAEGDDVLVSRTSGARPPRGAGERLWPSSKASSRSIYLPTTSGPRHGCDIVAPGALSAASDEEIFRERFGSSPGLARKSRGVSSSNPGRGWGGAGGEKNT